ncbi:MAG TPA: SWIM zinc finger family protein, partial [Acidimicrobiales bacterium]|nr:SWIM zinc finger family protein [Acidimicrobiales bacterium]
MAKRGFAETWWGRAWVDALEHRARLDPNRLPRGRTYARHNRVEDLHTAPGEVTAKVWGRQRSPYKVRIRVRTFSEAEWAGVTGAVAAKAAHAAALLDGELDPGVVDDAGTAGVALLPDAGDLQPRCSCPDWADPCKHSAAVCYLVAGLLDEDPFRLLELRGRRRPEVLAAVRRARAGATGSGAGGVGPTEGPAPGGRVPDAGVPAAAAWRRPLGALPAVPPGPAAPGRPAPWHADPPS